MPSIEDLILSHDRRGIALLRSHLPADYCTLAARLAYANCQRTIIVTGFYLLGHRAPETDGPPGAVAIGRAIQALGGQVWYVVEPSLPESMCAVGVPNEEIIAFPILPAQQSRSHALSLAEQYQPTLVISVEHCAQTARGVYLNSRAQDITACTAKPDSLFEMHIPSIGIGDGGNEIGMGNLAQFIPTIEQLPREPAATTVDALVIASISNWGAYGIVAAMSTLAGQNLLPSVAAEHELITRLYKAGCYDGLQPLPALGVDGFLLEEYLEVLAKLHAHLDNLA